MAGRRELHTLDIHQGNPEAAYVCGALAGKELMQKVVKAAVHRSEDR